MLQHRFADVRVSCQIYVLVTVSYRVRNNRVEPLTPLVRDKGSRSWHRLHLIEIDPHVISVGVVVNLFWAAAITRIGQRIVASALATHSIYHDRSSGLDVIPAAIIGAPVWLRAVSLVFLN